MVMAENEPAVIHWELRRQECASTVYHEGKRDMLITLSI
jgi:hypothetical protein